ncbi:biotin/lipoyl-binding carrier protein [Hydrogenophaga sp. BPS33]|uniref:biotin/lipoyl-binding carrier protein n=1 Tax=Hydrogenophaga sp. BPS33 TaxID=2651974 RepID=UPI00131FAB9F|nr:biotin/lipoyl-binding carrier protein [Hydrogenophaga sp. BPS33]QHE85764.1 biotin/lipoyl-binding carrier protein [Hydrogenophaga sp. BPS33]
MTKSVEVISEISGNVWKVEAQPGQTVAEGDVLVVVESMKMEIPVEAPCAGVLRSLSCQEGQPVREGEVIGVVDAA